MSIRSELEVAGYVIDVVPQVLHVVGEESSFSGTDGCCGNDLQATKSNTLISQDPHMSKQDWSSSQVQSQYTLQVCIARNNIYARRKINVAICSHW